MTLLAWVRDPVGHVKKYFDLGVICFKDVGRFDDCDQVWAVGGVVGGLICVVGLGFIVRHFYGEYSAHQRYRTKRLAELEVAPEDIMKKHVWNDDKLVDPDLSQKEIILRIKTAKMLQRMDEGNKPSGNTALGRRE